MEFSLKTRKDIIIKEASKYQHKRKKEKGAIISRVMEIIGYNRKYAGWLLRQCGKKLIMKQQGKRIIFVGRIMKHRKAPRERKRIYDKEVLKILLKIWAIMDFACGKRLVAVMSTIVEKLEKVNEITIKEEVREKLLNISAATIDRLLKQEKKDLQLKGKGHTKPGSLLKSQIPIRTFSEWNENRPGFIEIDLVAHDGGNARGDFNCTLDGTDIATGWTEAVAIKNKAQVWTFNALTQIEEKLPFDLLGVDSDNGSEFINNQLLRYCHENKITFTRSRPYRKNDNCFVEQKNWSVVRKVAGYYRYDSIETLHLLNKIYNYHRLYNNFFQPNMKLIEKTRIGSKIKKKYDKAKTPYQRVLESPYVSEENKNKLKLIYESLNPAELLRCIEKNKKALIKLASRCDNVILDNEIKTS
jgi:hypothetical protein